MARVALFQEQSQDSFQIRVGLDHHHPAAAAQVAAKSCEVTLTSVDVVIGVHNENDVERVSREFRVVFRRQHDFDVALCEPLFEFDDSLGIDVDGVDTPVGAYCVGEVGDEVTLARPEVGDAIALAKLERRDDFVGAKI